jgi:DICT domain-containing protein
MSLGAIIDRVDAAERRLTLVSPPSDDVVNAVERTFGPQGVSVEVREGTDQSVAVVHDGDEVIRIVPLVEGGSGLAAATDAVTDALSSLERTTFTSYGLRGMFAATREIEDRAWRVRRGRLRAGFQQVDALEQQKRVYRQLASALEVHAYAAPGVATPDLGDAVVHLDPAEEIARSWFVVYDGDGDPAHKCALVAEERGERTFSGFLTYEPSLVDEVDDYLAETY